MTTKPIHLISCGPLCSHRTLVYVGSILGIRVEKECTANVAAFMIVFGAKVDKDNAVMEAPVITFSPNPQVELTSTLHHWQIRNVAALRFQLNPTG